MGGGVVRVEPSAHHVGHAPGGRPGHHGSALPAGQGAEHVQGVLPTRGAAAMRAAAAARLAAGRGRCWLRCGVSEERLWHHHHVLGSGDHSPLATAGPEDRLGVLLPSNDDRQSRFDQGRVSSARCDCLVPAPLSATDLNGRSAGLRLLVRVQQASHRVPRPPNLGAGARRRAESPPRDRLGGVAALRVEQGAHRVAVVLSLGSMRADSRGGEWVSMSTAAQSHQHAGSV